MIILDSAAQSQVELPNPQWSYETDIHLALKMSRNPFTGAVKSWDNETTCDYRTCSAKWMLTQSELIGIHNFLSNAEYGRCKDFIIIPANLGSHSGFFPFGADKGDSQAFDITEFSNERSGRLLRPYNKYEFSMSFLMRSAPTCVLPEEIDQGNTIIGGIEGLPFIHDIKVNYVKGWRTDISAGGKPVHLDYGIKACYTDSEISFECNQSKCAALLNRLVTTIRGNDFQISTPINSYIFGAENGSAGTYVCQLADNTIKVIHGGYDKFRINLKLHMKSRVS